MTITAYFGDGRIECRETCKTLHGVIYDHAKLEDVYSEPGQREYLEELKEQFPNGWTSFRMDDNSRRISVNVPTGGRVEIE